MVAGSDTPTCDVLVAGAGPAGLCLAAAMAQRGLDVATLSPPRRPAWPNTYGIWFDELEAAGLADCARRQWTSPRVYLSEDGGRILERAYALVDNERMRRVLLERAAQNGHTWRDGRAREICRGRRETLVYDEQGRGHRARLVVDATGHRPALVELPPAEPAFQRAVGVVVRCEGAPLGGEGMWLMDYRSLPDEAADTDTAPSFLYAMSLGRGRYFFEETFLLGRPPGDFGQLERRLRARLAGLGVDPAVVDDSERVCSRERVSIPMGGRPPLSGLAVGFGAAARMVHPATGYMVGSVLRVAEEVAQATADVLSDAQATTHEIAATVRQAIWPEHALRTRSLLEFGREALLALDGAAMRRFFEAFFGLPTAQWSRYLSGRIEPFECAHIMWSLFRLTPPSLRFELGRMAASKKVAHLLRGLSPML